MNDLNPLLAVERVKRGAEMLDKHEPNWWTSISIPGLHLSSCSSCILGQLSQGRTEGSQTDFGKQLRTYMVLEDGWDANDLNDEEEFAMTYGFDVECNVGTHYMNYGYDHLQSAWEAEIQARLDR